MTDHLGSGQSGTKTVLNGRYSGGPHGLGDPNDKTLRRVEIDVMVPKKMRDIARDEKCHAEVLGFSQCCKDSSLLMSFKCRNENAALKKCLTKWYENEEFKERCRNEYLAERSEYRRTGLTQKQQRIAASM